jgi:exodeoxyribonuclease VII small subunit
MPKAAIPTAKTPAAASADVLPANYETALAELEQLIAQIESGQLPLDQLLRGYQRGAALLVFCRERLQAVEQQIKVLDDGVLRPWVAP